MTQISIEYVSIEKIEPRANNARTHSKMQIGQVARSIERFGFTYPILVDGEGRIIAGHCRYEAAKLLVLKTVPIIVRDDLSEAQIKVYMIADNKLAENAGWDRQQLAIEFTELGIMLEDLDIEITDTAFEMADIDVNIQEFSLPFEKDEADPADIIPAVAQNRVVTRTGDIWLLGNHRLICGDAKVPTVYDRLLAGQKAQMIFTDPPYNVAINGHVSGKGKAQHSEFHEASGEMSSAEFTQFLTDFCKCCVDASIAGSVHFICMDWRHMREMLNAGHDVYSELKNLCVWAKNNGGMGSLYRSRHELVFVFKAGTDAHINNVQLGRHGRNRTNLWEYNGFNSFGPGRDEALSAHPTVKPVGLVADAILDCSTRGSIVLDPFAGSGTTLIAAERTGRRGYGIEIDPEYCDLIIERMAKNCQLEAIHYETGKCFDEMRLQRKPVAIDADATPKTTSQLESVDGNLTTADTANANI